MEDKVIYIIDKTTYSEEKVRRLSREVLEELCSMDNYLEDNQILKVDANGYNSVKEALEGEGLEQNVEFSFVIAFGFEVDDNDTED
jgi:hypothetical protein